jgi:hypothetical protein
VKDSQAGLKHEYLEGGTKSLSARHSRPKQWKNIAATVFYGLDCALGLPGLLVSMVSVFLAINQLQLHELAPPFT